MYTRFGSIETFYLEFKFIVRIVAMSVLLNKYFNSFVIDLLQCLDFGEVSAPKFYSSIN